MAEKKSKRRHSEKNSSQLPKELYALEATVGQFMEYWGFKKIHGRIWAHLFTSKAAMDSVELMDRLKVSKGLMSLAIRDLLEFEVIVCDHVGRHGTTYYQANPDVLRVISNVLKSRETQMLKQARQATEALQKLGKHRIETLGLSFDRVQDVLQLTSSAQLILQAFLEQEHNSPYSFLFESPSEM